MNRTDLYYLTWKSDFTYTRFIVTLKELCDLPIVCSLIGFKESFSIRYP